MKVGGDDGELRPWHYIHVYRFESRLTRRVRYDSHTNGNPKQALLSKEHQGEKGKADGKLAQSLKVPTFQSICLSLRFSLFISVHVSVYLFQSMFQSLLNLISVHRQVEEPGQCGE